MIWRRSGIQKLRSVPEFQVDVKNKARPMRSFCQIIKDYDALVIRSATKVTAESSMPANKLKVVARAGIGLDNVDIEAASRRGIVVMNTPEGNVITTAEHVIAMMLALSRNIPQANSSLKAGKWEKVAISAAERYSTRCWALLALAELGGLSPSVPRA